MVFLPATGFFTEGIAAVALTRMFNVTTKLSGGIVGNTLVSVLLFLLYFIL